MQDLVIGHVGPGIPEFGAQGGEGGVVGDAVEEILGVGALEGEKEALEGVGEAVLGGGPAEGEGGGAEGFPAGETEGDHCVGVGVCVAACVRSVCCARTCITVLTPTGRSGSHLVLVLLFPIILLIPLPLPLPISLRNSPLDSPPRRLSDIVLDIWLDKEVLVAVQEVAVELLGVLVAVRQDPVVDLEVGEGGGVQARYGGEVGADGGAEGYWEGGPRRRGDGGGGHVV